MSAALHQLNGIPQGQAPQNLAWTCPPEQWQAARLRAQQAGRSVVAELQEETGRDAREVVAALAKVLGMRSVETSHLMACGPELHRLPLSRAMARHAALVRDDQGALVGVLSDPFDTDALIWLESRAGGPVPIWLATAADIHAYLARLEATTRATDGLHQEASPEESRGQKPAPVVSLASINESASPAVKLLNSILYDALKVGASDIHIESTPSGLHAKFRIDGVLDHALQVNGIETAEHVISRIKVLAELDIAERRVPQDGSFTVEAAGRDIDLRVSIMPSIHGEDAVIRVLDKRAMIET
jgi:general secretion pathway protein E